MEKRTQVPVLLFVILGTVLILFFGWYLSSYTRPLDDEGILAKLEPGTPTRDIEHALVQLGERLAPDHPARERFRPKLVALKDHERFEIRQKVALLMGREPAPEYHAALLEMIGDPDPSVRRNAACSLSNFNDQAARPVLREALEPVRLRAPAAGELDLKLKIEDSVSIGRSLGRVRTPAGEEVEVRASFSGRVTELPKGRQGAVAKDDVVAVVSPDPQSVLNVLVALRAVGTAEDADSIRPYAEGRIAGMTPEIAPEARRTLDRISVR